MTKINHILRFDKRIPQSKDLRIRLKAFWDWTFRMNEKFSSDSTGATVCSTQVRNIPMSLASQETSSMYIVEM